MLEHLRELAEKRADFSFETTMSGRAYAPWLAVLRAVGYEVNLYYYWLDSPDLAIRRVAERVKAGGHHVPDATIRQRYTKSERNFLDLYRQHADMWEVYDNSCGGRNLLALGQTDVKVEVGDEDLWQLFLRSAGA